LHDIGGAKHRDIEEEKWIDILMNRSLYAFAENLSDSNVYDEF